MKLPSICQTSGGILAILLASTGIITATITVDGIRDAGTETEYAAGITVDQGTVSNWNEGGHEALANLHAVQDGNTLAVHLAARIGRATPTVLGRSILLFIDSKSGGRTFIPNNLINYGGEENYINNLGTSSSVGMTFETGFTPDYAVRIYGDGATGAFVNLYDLNAGTRTEAGNAGVDAGVINKGFITQMKANNLGTGSIAANTTAYAAANTGVEMKLSLSALGVPSGAQPVRLMALLVDTDSMYGSNQVLATRSSNSDIAYGINSINFGSEANTQYIPISVTGPASRNVVFSVNMNDEITNGNFTAGTDKVKVIFFSGVASPTPGEIFLTGPEPGNIYTGTLVTEGATAASFGNYKFFNTRFGAPNFGYEYGDDRTFTLDPPGSTQTLATVVFRPNSFAIWSNTFAGNQSATQDSDGDGVDNALEYFMGSNNSQFTPTPQPVGNLVTWPRDPQATGTTFKVRTSPDLVNWNDASATVTQTSVTYTRTGSDPKLFVRLEVTVP